MRRFVSIALLASVPAVTALAFMDDLERLRDKQDRAALEQKAAELGGAAEKAPNDAAGWYRAAVAHSYLAEVSMELGDKTGAQHAAEDGVKEADKAISLNPANADYYRVLGQLCGQVIPANPILGAISYGRRAKDALDKAVAMDPKSSPAFVAQGVGFYYLPTNFGGGPEAAIKDFQRAIVLDPKSAEAYLWLGLAERKLHRNSEAHAALEKSLMLDPLRVWTKTQLDKTPAQ